MEVLEHQDHIRNTPKLVGSSSELSAALKDRPNMWVMNLDDSNHGWGVRL